MAFWNDGRSVVTCNAVVLWDGITRPETNTFDGQPSYSLNVAIPEMAVEKGELEQLATACLQASEFKGQLPMGGNWPIIPIDLSKFQEDAARLQGHVKINSKSKFVPQILDQNGQPLQPMQYGQMLYPGAVVKVLVGAYAFNNKSKGIAFSLEGVQIIDASAPKLAVGGAMTTEQIQGAFGAAPAPMGGQPTAPAPTGGQPTAPAPMGGQPTAPAPMGGQPTAPTGVVPAPDFANATPEKSYKHPNGQVYTETQLQGFGFTPEQIAMLQPV